VRILLPLLGAVLFAGCSSQPAAETNQTAAASPVKILQFYPSSSTVAKGDQVLICYGVEGAASVRLEPPIEQISPSFTRCFPYSPQSSTDIKIIATGSNGTEESKSLHVEVAGVARPPAGELIVSFMSSARTVPVGQEVTLCYETRNATSVKIEPDSANRKLPVKGCVTQVVKGKTTYTLMATGAGGKKDQEALTVAAQ